MQRTDPAGSSPDEVPKEVIDQAKAAFGRRSTGEVAILAWDSLVDEDVLAGDHRLRFEHADVQIDLRLLAGDRSADLEGQLTPPEPARVALQTETQDTLDATETSDGRFRFWQVPAGLVRLSVRPAGGPEIHTDWFRI